jgi:phosphonate transport system permease protein
MAVHEQPLSTPPVSPEALREKLLRPFPAITPRGLLIALVILLILAWSWQASRPSEINRVSGVMDALNGMVGLMKLMVPPQFELASGTKFTVDLFGKSVDLGWPVVVSAVVVTIQMAIIGTLGAVIMSLPLSLLAARNTSPYPALYQIVRFILNFLRSIPELVVALLFVAAVGLGPFPGVLALAFGSVGSLSRVYAEAIEQIDPQQVMALRASGAGGIQTFIYAVVPQALPLLISYSLVYLEHNVRTATILGYVGAGGIGYLLFAYMGFSAYPKVFGTVIVLVVAVTIVDRFSSSLRKRFI